MRINVRHETLYRYDRPAKGVIQILRLTPRDYDGQRVVDWGLTLNQDCPLRPAEDAFGNLTHIFTAEGPVTSIALSVHGEIETFDTMGVVKGAIERFPPELYLRETPLTFADTALRAFAHAATAKAREPLDKLHALLGALNRGIAFDTATTETVTTAAEAFAQRRGVCQDFAHVMIACARHLDFPARYVAGYFFRDDGVTDVDAGHAWIEAYVPMLGWVGFDPANGICPREGHVRLAVGLDYLGAAPVRGTRFGGAGEALEVKVRVAAAQAQTQN